MLQFESAFLPLSILFFFFGIMAFGWLVVHIEHGRHFSRFKVLFALVFGALFIGFGLHFFLLAAGL